MRRNIQVSVRTCELIIALNNTGNWSRGQYVCTVTYYLNKYQCFKSSQDHEDLEFSFATRKQKWNIKILKVGQN